MVETYAFSDSDTAPMQGPVAPPAGRQPKADAPFNAQAFIDANLIHVHDGSFIKGLLHVHPRELHPQQDATLKAKLNTLYSYQGYSWYQENPARGNIAIQLATLIPTPLSVKEKAIVAGLKDYHTQQTSNADPRLMKDLSERAAPFTNMVKTLSTEPEKHPGMMEMAAQGLVITLLIEEALKARGYVECMHSYVRRQSNPGNILVELQDKLGVNHTIFRVAAAQGGVDAIAQTLGISDTVRDEIKEIVHYAAEHEFSDNIITHWQKGRQQHGMATATLEEKIAKGREVRVQEKVTELRNKAKGRYEVPEDIAQKQQKVAGVLSLLPPIIAETLYELGADIVYSPYPNLSLVSGMGALGFHRHAADNREQVDAPRSIYISNNQTQTGMVETAIHEANHLIFPHQFDEQTQHQCDGLMAYDAIRLAKLKVYADAWLSSTDTEAKAHIKQAMNNEFSIGELTLDTALSSDTEMLRFCNMVQQAEAFLSPNSSEYAKFGGGSYVSNVLKMQEVIPRYSQMRYVLLRDNPAMMAFIAPGTTQMYDQHYLPHIEQQLAEIKAAKAQPEEVAYANLGQITQNLSASSTKVNLNNSAQMNMASNPIAGLTGEQQSIAGSHLAAVGTAPTPTAQATMAAAHKGFVARLEAEALNSATQHI